MQNDDPLISESRFWTPTLRQRKGRLDACASFCWVSDACDELLAGWRAMVAAGQQREQLQNGAGGRKGVQVERGAL